MVMVMVVVVVVLVVVMKEKKEKTIDGTQFLVGWGWQVGSLM
jgi:hypothetical protein